MNVSPGWNTQPLQQHLDGEETVTEPVVTPEAGAVTEPVVAPEADAFEDATVESFDRKYVTGIRGEAAKYRTAAKAWDDSFAGYSDEERGVWRELAAGLISDPKGTAARLQAIADRALGTGESETVVPAAEGDDAPLTKAQVQAMLKEREDAAELDKRVAGIKATAVGLGYEDGSVRYDILLRTAQKNGGDIQKAHAALEADKTAIIDAYLAAKVADATGSPTAAPGAAAPAQERKLKTFGAAGDALKEILRGQQAQ